MIQPVFQKVGPTAIYRFSKFPLKDKLPLVLLHGFCEDSSIWSGMLAAFTDLPVVMMDLPGFGGSDVPSGSSIEHYSGPILDACQAIGISNMVLLGHSLGGYVALDIAARKPERLAGLGLFHAHPLADTEERKEARARGVDMVRAGKRDLYVSQLFPNLFSKTFGSDHPEIVQQLISNGKKQPEEGIILALQAMAGRPDRRAVLSEIRVPVMSLQGVEDGLIPLKEIWEAALLPDTCAIDILEGVAHMGMYEAPQRCAEKITFFYNVSVG